MVSKSASTWRTVNPQASAVGATRRSTTDRRFLLAEIDEGALGPLHEAPGIVRHRVPTERRTKLVAVRRAGGRPDELCLNGRADPDKSSADGIDPAGLDVPIAAEPDNHGGVGKEGHAALPLWLSSSSCSITDKLTSRGRAVPLATRGAKRQSVQRRRPDLVAEWQGLLPGVEDTAGEESVTQLCSEQPA